MRKVDSSRSPHYKYIAVYLDDLLIESNLPQAIVDLLIDKHKFKLKRTGPIKHQLGFDFAPDVLTKLGFASRKHIKKMCMFFILLMQVQGYLDFSLRTSRSF